MTRLSTYSRTPVPPAPMFAPAGQPSAGDGWVVEPKFDDGRPGRWNSAVDKRWIPVRPDREPASCTFAQLDVPLDYDLSDVQEG